MSHGSLGGSDQTWEKSAGEAPPERMTAGLRDSLGSTQPADGGWLGLGVPARLNRGFNRLFSPLTLQVPAIRIPVEAVAAWWIAGAKVVKGGGGGLIVGGIVPIDP